ncbi:MAG: MFS transporter [Stigonema ocellatum SAG 48.90 = DSM 106950]|nr:MFS transporter [Stigonema ocellatum SAG 48.90 = DSM 106950]
MLSDSRLLVLLAAGSLTTMAGGVVAPILPEMVQQLHLDPRFAGNLVSLHCLTIALTSPPLGILADRIGRLRVLIPSLILFALFGMAGALMNSLEPLLVSRALLGAASGGIAAASLGLLGSMYEGKARSQALGYATSALTITGIAFPLLGGLVGAINWRFAFLLYGLGLPLALLANLVLNPKQPKQPPSTPTTTNKQIGQMLRHSQIWLLLLIIGLNSVAMYAVVIYAPLYLKQTIGAGSVLNGIVLASRAIGAALVSAIGSRYLAQSLGTAKAIAVGFALMAVTLVTIPFLKDIGWILLTAILFGVGFGITLPNLYDSLARLSPKELGSSVLAAGTGVSFLGQFLSPILLGPVVAFGGMEGVFYAAAGVTVIAGILLFVPTRYINS